MATFCVINHDFQIFNEPTHIRISAINKINFDKYESVIMENEIITKTNFTRDKDILYSLITDCFKTFPAANNNISLSIQLNESNLTLNFKSNDIIKYFVIDFNIILDKHKIAEDEYLRKMIEQTNQLTNTNNEKINNILEYMTELQIKNKSIEEKIRNQSDLIKELRHDICIANAKCGNYIVLGDGHTIFIGVNEIDSVTTGINFFSNENGIYTDRYPIYRIKAIDAGSGSDGAVQVLYNKYRFINNLDDNELLPLNFLKDLKKITIFNHKITNLNCIKDCDKIEEINIESNSLCDISSLSDKKVTKVTLKCPKITDITPLKDIMTLTELKITGCGVKNCLIMQQNINLKIIQ